MDLALLETLKQKLLQAQEFQEIWEYFMDHFGEDPDFMALGERTRNPFLEAVMSQVGQQLFGGPVQTAECLLTRLPEQQFIHGGCILAGKAGNVLYFEDAQVGLLAVVISLAPSETRLVRFTGRPLRVN
jgi:hypothetical protein